MTIDEAIKNCHEKAEEQKIKAERYGYNGLTGANNECLECAKEHEQLAEWLEELKQLRAENDGLKNQLDDLCENLAWYINERNRLISEKEANNGRSADNQTT